MNGQPSLAYEISTRRGDFEGQKMYGYSTGEGIGQKQYANREKR
jgi:hypothetical protein